MIKKLAATIGMLLMITSAHAGGGLDSFLSNLNVRANVNLDNFSATVSTQFGIPEVKVRAVIGSVDSPADAFMVFQLGQWAGLPPDRVVEVYNTSKGKGWGVMAKQLGIKPGSAEFHRLKSGDLHYADSNAGYSSEDHGHGHGKGKGHGKNKD